MEEQYFLIIFTLIKFKKIYCLITMHRTMAEHFILKLILIIVIFKKILF